MRKILLFLSLALVPVLGIISTAYFAMALHRWVPVAVVVCGSILVVVAVAVLTAQRWGSMFEAFKASAEAHATMDELESLIRRTHVPYELKRLPDTVRAAVEEAYETFSRARNAAVFAREVLAALEARGLNLMLMSSSYYEEVIHQSKLTAAAQQQASKACRALGKLLTEYDPNSPRVFEEFFTEALEELRPLMDAGSSIDTIVASGRLAAVFVDALHRLDEGDVSGVRERIEAMFTMSNPAA